MRSPVKYLTDAQYAALPIQERALIFASAQVGKREEGKNAGPFVTRLLAAVGLGAGFPWCASFVSFCLKAVGFNGGPAKGRAKVRNWAGWAKTLGIHTPDPQRGDLFYWLNDNLTGHIGFVTEVHPNGTFMTISGNTNDAGSREGDGVYRKLYTRSPRMRFIRWWE